MCRGGADGLVFQINLPPGHEEPLEVREPTFRTRGQCILNRQAAPLALTNESISADGTLVGTLSRACGAGCVSAHIEFVFT